VLTNKNNGVIIQTRNQGALRSNSSKGGKLIMRKLFKLLILTTLTFFAFNFNHVIADVLDGESINEASDVWCICPITTEAAYDVDKNTVFTQIANSAIEFINTGKISDFPMMEFTITVKEH
jgi:hypothetical protein